MIRREAGGTAPVWGPATLAGSGWGGGVMDEIDRSESEGEEAGLLGGALLAAGGDEFPGFGGGADLDLGMLGEPLLQLEQYAEAMGISDGLLQQIPVQELLEMVMQMPGAGGLPWPFGGALHGGGSYSAAAGAGFAGAHPHIPAGLHGSARRHAVSMAGQGFATALDPSRRAACAAEGIPCGRQQASPRTRHYHRTQNVWAAGGGAGTAAAAAPAAAAAAGRAAGSRSGGAGPLAAPLLARSLQRVDSASGLQRGDSAASQGGSSSSGGGGGGGGGMRQAAALAPRQGLARLMGAAATRGVAGHARRSSSSSSEEPPGLVDGSGEEEERQQQQQRRQGAAQQQAPPQQQQRPPPPPQAPPRRRLRRNAVFGQLPGLESSDAAAAVAAAAAAAQAVAGSTDSDGEGLQEQAGTDWGSDQAPPALASRGSSEVEGEEEGAGGEGAWGLPPPLEVVLSSSEEEGEEQQHWMAQGDEEQEADDGDPPPLLESSEAGSASSSDSGVSNTGGGAWTGLGGGQQTASTVAAAQRPAFSADQHTVMQALSTLLPQQADATGWAELASYVRHSSSSGGSSGGGVQLLSRLVAAAADRFPAEAEMAGLTERPLGLLPPAPLQPAAVTPGTADVVLGDAGDGLAVTAGLQPATRQEVGGQAVAEVTADAAAAFQPGSYVRVSLRQAGYSTIAAAAAASSPPAGGELAVLQSVAGAEAAAATAVQPPSTPAAAAGEP
ncbi:hypothetical protein ACK3TF_002667 [Chlorella vulgaris]